MNILFKGKVVTLDSQNSIVEFLLVENDKIKYVGNEKPDFRYDVFFDLKDKVIMPGFIDTHTHFFELAKRKVLIDLSSSKSVNDIREILKKYKKNMNKSLNWIGGSGWNKNIYKDLTGFNKCLLDEFFPDIPVSLESKDFHSKLCNSKALEEAGINEKTPDPFGGKIGRFENGEPDGFIYEKAWDLINKVKTELPYEIQREIVLETVKDCWEMGLTAVHVMEDKNKFNLYKSLIDEGLNFRFCWHFPSSILDEMIGKGIISYSGDEYLKIGGQKIFMDGAVGSQTAFMYEKYPESNSYGTIIYDKEMLNKMVSKGVKHNISSSIHAIGDRCVNIVVDCLVNNQKENIMHRIEHLQAVHDSDLDKLKGKNIYIAAQSVHIKDDIDTMRKYWPKAQFDSYKFKSIIDRNIPLGFGSDAPVESINPMFGVYSALERKRNNNPKEESWTPNQKINLFDVLKCYTIDAAKGSCSQNVRGSLEVGKMADIIVLDNFFEKNNEFWLNAKSKLTMINGKIVFSGLK